MVIGDLECIYHDLEYPQVRAMINNLAHGYARSRMIMRKIKNRKGGRSVKIILGKVNYIR